MISLVNCSMLSLAWTWVGEWRWWSCHPFFLLCVAFLRLCCILTLCCFPRLCYASGMIKILYNGGKN